MSLFQTVKAILLAVLARNSIVRWSVDVIVSDGISIGHASTEVVSECHCFQKAKVSGDMLSECHCFQTVKAFLPAMLAQNSGDMVSVSHCFQKAKVFLPAMLAQKSALNYLE